LDYQDNVIASFNSVMENIVVVISKVSDNIYKVIELIEPTEVFNDLSFSVSSDAVVSDDLSFDGIITIDPTSEVLHPFVLSATYESSLDGVNYTLSNDLTSLQSWINTNGLGTTYTIRALSVYNVGSFGSGTVGFSYK